MTPLQAAILGIVQGLTELLPVSSTAHLVLVERWLGVAPGLAFDVALHGGTLGAIVIAFRRDLGRLLAAGLRSLRAPDLRGDPEQRVFWLLGLASIPAGAAGILLKDWIEGALRAPWVIGLALVAVGVAILLIERRVAGRRELASLGVVDAVLIGCCQALALVPGVSRSGSTIGGGLVRGLGRDAAVRFSFLLGIPVIAGGVLLEARGLARDGFGEAGWQAFAIGVGAAFASGYVAVEVLLRFVRTQRFTVFMVYRIGLGLVVLGLAAAGRM